MKKVLITGASGFIGQACLKALQLQELEIHAISTKSVQKRQNKTTWHQLDLHDYAVVKDLMTNIKPTHLLHLAWYVEHGTYWSSNENLKWVATSLNLATEFVNNGGNRLVCAGTCAEYDWSTQFCTQGLIEDTSPLNPHTLYGACKTSLYNTLLSFTQTKDLSFAWGRLFFPYGPNENPKRLIPSAVISLLQNKPAICNNADLQRDFIFIEDVGRIFAKLINSETTDAINVASGQAVPLEQVVKTIANLLNTPDLVDCKTNANNADPAILVANVNKLTNDLKYVSKTTLENGLTKTIAWWKETYNSSLH